MTAAASNSDPRAPRSAPTHRPRVARARDGVAALSGCLAVGLLGLSRGRSWGLGLVGLAVLRSGVARVAAANIAPHGLLPQADTAGNAIVVRCDPHVSREFDGQVARVAAAQVQ